MDDQQHKKIELKIHGMHCASCEVLIERKFKKIPGVEKVNVNHTNGCAEIYCSQDPNVAELDNAVKDNGYRVTLWNDANQHNNLKQSINPHKNSSKDYIQIGAIFLIVVSLYLLFKQLGLVPNLGLSNNMSYGFIFLIGLVAAMSTCIAVTGGLLMAVAAKYNEQNASSDGWTRFKPTLYFNVGRVVSYTVLGGVVGGLGSFLTLSPRVNGIVSIVASLVMIILGFQLLKLFPWLSRFQPRIPKFIGHKIHGIGDSQNKLAPFMLGAGTFFLPCGFTQALQLYVLSKGDPVVGALTMLAFSLGTLPALLSLSAISSFVKGTIQSYFLKFAGVVVILLGFFNVSNGLTLAGFDFNLASAIQRNNGSAVLAAATENTNVKVVDGKQIVQMKVSGLSYTPHQFTVLQGVPVEWQIDGTEAQGCAQVITVPSLGITEYLPKQGIKTIQFTPQQPGAISFSCTMGMTTRGSAFVVVPNTKGVVAAKTGPENTQSPTGECDPTISDCNVQKVTIEISKERGIYPNVITVKKGTPVEVNIDAKIQLNGCMSTMVIPKYNKAHFLALGESKFLFTPTKTGSVPFTCSMGGGMGRFEVID